MSGLSKSTSDNNTQAKTKQNGASSLDPDTGKFSPITDPDAWSLDKALATSSQDMTNQAISGEVNQELLNYELNRYFAGVNEFGFKVDEDLVNMALPTIKKSHSDPFGGFLVSTPENPYGLSQAQRAKVDYLASNPLMNAEAYNELSFYEQQHYEIARDKHIMSLAGPQLVASNPVLEARNARARDYFVDSNNSPWHLTVSKGINDWGMAVGIWNKPLQFAKAYAGYQAADIAGSAYQNREQLAQIWNEAKQNRGMTLALGVTPSATVANAQGAAAVGGWLSVDFNNMDINVGGYWSAESGPKLGLANFSLDWGVETTVFTSPSFERALSGPYQLYGAGYNQNSLSFIKADFGRINGYQYTWDFAKPSKSLINYKHDGSIVYRSGYGGIWRGNN